MTGITIVSPGYPQQPGGVTDHTARLCRHWSQDDRIVRVWSDLRMPGPSAVAEWGETGVKAVLIQYVPFLYGRRGLSSVPERIAAEAGRCGMRVTTFVHEPWVPPTRLPWLVLTVLQRRQLHRLVKVSDAVVTPVPKWAALLGSSTHVVYVGSTLVDPLPRSDPTPLTGPVVFSPFAAGLNWRWIIAAARAIRADPELLVIGGTEAAAMRQPMLRRFVRPGWVWHDYGPGGPILDLLSRSRLVLAPFVDGLTGRRTSALAAAGTGVRVLSSRGPLFDPWFDNAPIQLANSEAEFAARARELWHSTDADAARISRLDWYRNNLDPRELDDRLLRIVVGHAA